MATAGAGKWRGCAGRSSRIAHAFVFFQSVGTPIKDLSYPYTRWRYVLAAARVRYREPYDARHSFISWSLMTGRNLLKLAQEDGHGVQTMLNRYAAWLKGATEEDVAAIKSAMERAPADARVLRDPEATSH